MPRRLPIPRLRLPERIPQRWRARLRAWRRGWPKWARGGGEVLFPATGQGMVAVQTLGGATGRTGRPRVAILHATAGSGHRSAAQALAAAIVRQSPGAAVREVDTLVFASRLYRSTYAASYNAMAARAPRLWGVLYHSWARAPVNRSTAPLRLALDRLNLRRLVRVTERESPDAIVCTHFLPVEALSPRRGHGHLRVPLFCVITDFVAHPFWAFPHVDRYFVASEEVAAQLAGHGVEGSRIEVTGIPVDPRFARPIPREAARARLGLPAGRPAVLVMGGGSGVGPLAELAERLAALPARPWVIVACGTNERLRLEVAALPSAREGGGSPPAIRAIGFTREVDVWLEACDLLVGKAGGLTCSEALVKGVPIVVFKPTPGQEVRNADYLQRHGAAANAGSVEVVASTVGHWLSDPAELGRRRSAARSLGRPAAAEAIARRVLEATEAR